MKGLRLILSLLLLFIADHSYSQNRSKGLRVESSDGKQFRRWAVVIGINSWHDVSIVKLNKARNDAKEFSRLLKEKGEFDEIVTLTDDNDPRSSLYPSKNNIQAKLELILENAEPNDLFLFYFSGHGISDKDENAYLIPADAIFEKPFETSVSVENIISLLKKKNMKKTLLILDACRETVAKVKGAGQNSIRAEKYGESEIGAVFFSTGSGSYSYEDHESENGVFTRFLTEGIAGQADTDHDGTVTFSELENFVQEKVRGWSLKFNKKQKPYVRFSREKSGDIPITAVSPSPHFSKQEPDSNAIQNNAKKETLSLMPSLNGKKWKTSGQKSGWLKASALCSSLQMTLPSAEELLNLHKSKADWKKKDCSSPCIYWTRDTDEYNAYTVSMEDGMKTTAQKILSRSSICIEK